MIRFVDVDAFKEWLLENSINEREVEESNQIGIWIDAFYSMQNEQSDCEDCIKHGGDWECDRVHCHKGDVPDTNVGELISRQEAIGCLDDQITVTGEQNAIEIQNYIRRVANRLNDLPSVQPNLQPIVSADRRRWRGGYDDQSGDSNPRNRPTD